MKGNYRLLNFVGVLLLSPEYRPIAAVLSSFRCVFDTLPNHVRPGRHPYIFDGGVVGSVRQPRPGVSVESDSSSTR